MIKYILGLALLPALAFGQSSNRTTPTQFLKNGSTVITVPTGVSNDTMVLRNTSETLTNKLMDGGSNTFTNVPLTTAGTGQLPVANGGTGAATLAAHGLLVGEGTSAIGSLTGAQYQPMVFNGSGDPSAQALNLAQSAAVTGTLGVANGGTNNPSLAVTNGGVVSTDGSKQINVGAGTAGQLLFAGTPPTWGNNTMTHTLLVTTGTTAGYWFTITSAAANITTGCTYTNNGATFVIINTVSTSATRIWASATGAPTSSGTLTYSSGGGSACNGGTGTNITFSANVALATYSPPANTRLLKIITIGGGGGGGSCTSTASNSCAGGGGAGAAVSVSYLSTIPALCYYSVGTGGAAATAGVLTSFICANTFGAYDGGGAAAGTTGPTTLGFGNGGTQTGGVGANGGTLNWEGHNGFPGIVLNGTTLACAGAGGGTILSPADGPGANCSGNAGGNNGKAYGAGGGGAVNVNGGGSQTGGTGSNGIVWIEEYY